METYYASLKKDTAKKCLVLEELNKIDQCLHQIALFMAQKII